MQINTAAHQGALNGHGKTVAILANGLDTVTPRKNEKLAHDILEHGGTWISEQPVGAHALKHHFVINNH